MRETKLQVPSSHVFTNVFVKHAHLSQFCDLLWNDVWSPLKYFESLQRYARNGQWISYEETFSTSIAFIGFLSLLFPTDFLFQRPPGKVQ